MPTRRNPPLMKDAQLARTDRIRRKLPVGTFRGVTIKGGRVWLHTWGGRTIEVADNGDCLQAQEGRVRAKLEERTAS